MAPTNDLHSYRTHARGGRSRLATGAWSYARAALSKGKLTALDTLQVGDRVRARHPIELMSELGEQHWIARHAMGRVESTEPLLGACSTSSGVLSHQDSLL
jgi:hypothetical protein